MPKAPLRAQSRASRKLQIVTVMLLRIECGYQPCTTHSLALTLDMRPSPHLTKIVDELVEEGLINKIETNHRPGWKKYLLQPNIVLIKHYYPKVWKLHVQRKEERNQIRVNASGQQPNLFANWRNEEKGSD